jgi:hypothetical protein
VQEKLIEIEAYGTAEGQVHRVIASATLEQAMRWTAAIEEVFREMEKA